MTLAASDVAFLQDLIVKRSGHVVTDEQGYLFESRLKSLASSEGLQSVEELVARTRKRNTPQISDRIAEAMTINETFFFRDVHPFTALQKSIIPQLIEARKEARTLNIWAAACSSGQEPYSIAITLREHFPELADWDIQIMASDLSDNILEKAQSGEYTQFEVNRGMPARILIKHFERRGATWFVKDHIREMMKFKKVNLTKAWFMDRQFDIVFLRNVLIYFSVDTKAQILKRIHGSLSKDGYLFLGGGESLININVPFQRETIEQATCFRPTA